MNRNEALECVLTAALEWAGEYGFVDPKTATKVYEAIELLDEEENTHEYS